MEGGCLPTFIVTYLKSQLHRGCFRDWGQLFLLFSNQELLENMVEKTLGDVGKAKIFVFRQQSCQKKFMDARNNNVLVGEN